MASRLLLRPLRPFALPAAFSITSILTLQPLLNSRPALKCDAPAPFKPLVKQGGISQGALKQVSSGVLLGLAGGVLVSFFSKPLALLIGLLVAGVQYMEHIGIHVVPYKTMQRYFKGIDIKSAVQDNVAFKLSFGLSFALAGFGSL
ncbi:hypothetical protein BT63DRAFT_482114 [Microthyrium microscopicum]|uniref:FUN14-domain-containing protein n=1 Tax=Microthyrium microscopicum TaxID=703497 RepID=A0A6A6U5E7_9PEZI|nr:hypothetical protein BT63DRAFT_482114 [Microthyrium microscopicum]